MPESLSRKLHRIAETAKAYPEFQFKTLAHLLTVQMLGEALGKLRKDAAAGIDEVTAKQFEANQQRNLADLHQRLRERRYRAQPLRRVYIEKEDGKQRALAIPTLEDKIVQKATSELLNRIYEADFLPCSYGYRPKRSAHDALEELAGDLNAGKMNYVLDADIQDYFGSIVRSELEKMLQKRIQDKDILRLIGKWLHVGVIEDGRLLMSEDGTYQGSVISPLLANVYLHEVLDRWVEIDVKPRMKGAISLYRFADDFVMCFERKDDADRVMAVLARRFSRYGLTLHPEKTKLIEFGPTAWGNNREKPPSPPTFNFLGFAIINAGNQVRTSVKLKTMSKRLSRGLKRVAQWCRANRHQPLEDQYRRLRAVLRGHYQYYGRRTNYRAIASFHNGVIHIWRKWLDRRDRDRHMQWNRYVFILKKYPLPRPRITQARFGYTIPLFGEVI